MLAPFAPADWHTLTADRARVKRFQEKRILPRSHEKEVGMTMFAKVRRDLVLGPVVLAALVAAAAAGGQQPGGEPFSTAITRLKDGLYVIRYASFETRCRR
jgi:hypothetical protein